MHISHSQTKYEKLRKIHYQILVLWLSSRKTSKNWTLTPNAWTIRFNEIYEYFLCVTPKTVFFSCGCKYHIFLDFHLMYCWHILANKHHDMPDTNYDKFNLVVSTLFLNKWYLKKSTFFENDPYNTWFLQNNNYL